MRRDFLVAAGALGAAAIIAAGGATGAYGSPGAEAAQRALQATASTSSHQCSGSYSETPATATTPFMQSCTITPAAGSNVACVEQTDAPWAVQTCDITQVGTTTDNNVTVSQTAATDAGGFTQDHTQNVFVHQTNGSASNFAGVGQVVKQSLGPGHFDDTDEGEPDSDTSTSSTGLATTQELHQIVTVDQSTDAGTSLQAGNNNSSVSQFGKQRVRINHAPAISEHQNTQTRGNCPASDDPNANQCSVVNQTSTNGQNVSSLSDTYSQFERAHDASAGDQIQGISASSGGIDHEIHQSSSGFCKISTDQSESQVQRAVQAPIVQTQHGPTRKGIGSNQACSPSSTWTGSQDSSQVATSRPNETDIGTSVFGDPAFQDNNMEYFGVSTGDIRATQTVSEQTNGRPMTQQNACPQPGSAGANHVCAATIVCGEATAGIAGAPTAGAGTCVASNEANPCPPGTFPNPVTGRCEGG